MDTETAPPRTGPSTTTCGPRSRRSLILGAAVPSALAVALVVSLAVGLVTHASLDGASGRLESARAGLAQSQEVGKAATVRLHQLSDAAAADARVVQADTTQLSTLDSQLGLSQAHVVSQGVRISDLDACLSGVEQALNQISLGNQAGAGATLGAVGPACSGAEPST